MKWEARRNTGKNSFKYACLPKLNKSDRGPCRKEEGLGEPGGGGPLFWKGENVALGRYAKPGLEGRGGAEANHSAIKIVLRQRENPARSGNTTCDKECRRGKETQDVISKGNAPVVLSDQRPS